ncbi:MAG: hypothetical protein ACD_65C00274G0001 [uncultured bacterium]|nr:MAG: hypothetical protein ACD_65C00274G0001 [uncultured bacterium]
MHPQRMSVSICVITAIDTFHKIITINILEHITARFNHKIQNASHIGNP